MSTEISFVIHYYLRTTPTVTIAVKVCSFTKNGWAAAGVAFSGDRRGDVI